MTAKAKRARKVPTRHEELNLMRQRVYEGAKAIVDRDEAPHWTAADIAAMRDAMALIEISLLSYEQLNR